MSKLVKKEFKARDTTVRPGEVAVEKSNASDSHISHINQALTRLCDNVAAASSEEEKAEEQKKYDTMLKMTELAEAILHIGQSAQLNNPLQPEKPSIGQINVPSQFTKANQIVAKGQARSTPASVQSTDPVIDIMLAYCLRFEDMNLKSETLPGTQGRKWAFAGKGTDGKDQFFVRDALMASPCFRGYTGMLNFSDLLEKYPHLNPKLEVSDKLSAFGATNLFVRALVVAGSPQPAIKIQETQQHKSGKTVNKRTASLLELGFGAAIVHPDARLLPLDDLHHIACHMVVGMTGPSIRMACSYIADKFPPLRIVMTWYLSQILSDTFPKTAQDITNLCPVFLVLTKMFSWVYFVALPAKELYKELMEDHVTQQRLAKSPTEIFWHALSAGTYRTMIAAIDKIVESVLQAAHESDSHVANYGSVAAILKLGLADKLVPILKQAQLSFQNWRDTLAQAQVQYAIKYDGQIDKAQQFFEMYRRDAQDEHGIGWRNVLPMLNTIEHLDEERFDEQELKWHLWTLEYVTKWKLAAAGNIQGFRILMPVQTPSLDSLSLRPTKRARGEGMDQGQ